MLVLQEESNFRTFDLDALPMNNREFVYEPMRQRTTRGGVEWVEIIWYPRELWGDQLSP